MLAGEVVRLTLEGWDVCDVLLVTELFLVLPNVFPGVYFSINSADVSIY